MWGLGQMSLPLFSRNLDEVVPSPHENRFSKRSEGHLETRFLNPLQVSRCWPTIVFHREKALLASRNRVSLPPTEWLLVSFIITVPV